jgi:uncharacterized protein (DUF1697 family)
MAGHNIIKMADLATLFKKIGFRDAETFIGSGNVIFRNMKSLTAEEIALKIEKAIMKEFRYDIAAMIRTPEELRKIILNNPFAGEKNFNPAKMACLFLHETPSDLQVSKMKDVDYPPDKFQISGNVIYIWCPNGFGRSKLYTNFFENKMKVKGTARNWKTINSLVEIATGK